MAFFSVTPSGKLIQLNTIFRSYSKVKVIGRSSRLQEENVAKVIGAISREVFLVSAQLPLMYAYPPICVSDFFPNFTVVLPLPPHKKTFDVRLTFAYLFRNQDCEKLIQKNRERGVHFRRNQSCRGLDYRRPEVSGNISTKCRLLSSTPLRDWVNVTARVSLIEQRANKMRVTFDVFCQQRIKLASIPLAASNENRSRFRDKW